MTHRVAELIERLQQIDSGGYVVPVAETPPPAEIIVDGRDQNGADSHKIVIDLQHEGYCLLDGASFRAPGRPTEDLLVRDLTLHLRPGQSMLITGSSSAGKTSLLRVLRGLWRLSSGSLKTRYAPGPSGVLFLPQKPYLTDGTLREQVLIILIAFG